MIQTNKAAPHSSATSSSNGTHGAETASSEADTESVRITSQTLKPQIAAVAAHASWRIHGGLQKLPMIRLSLVKRINGTIAKGN